jgi:hypothetical protein
VLALTLDFAYQSAVPALMLAMAIYLAIGFYVSRKAANNAKTAGHARLSIAGRLWFRLYFAWTWSLGSVFQALLIILSSKPAKRRSCLPIICSSKSRDPVAYYRQLQRPLVGKHFLDAAGRGPRGPLECLTRPRPSSVHSANKFVHQLRYGTAEFSTLTVCKSWRTKKLPTDIADCSG